VFVTAQARGAHPMLALNLFRSRTFTVVIVVGFTFMACYYGLPFVMSLDLQQVKGLTALQTGLVFVPMMLVGALLTPFSARLVERFGTRTVITVGLLLMTAGLLGPALLPTDAPVWVLSVLMLLVGLAGPTVMPPATAALLAAVAPERAGTAGGALNTSRQVGGALAVAVFGALLARPDAFTAGMRARLLNAAGLALATATITAVFLTRSSRPQLSGIR
jgi:sugar phosphate permease